MGGGDWCFRPSATHRHSAREKERERERESVYVSAHVCLWGVESGECEPQAFREKEREREIVCVYFLWVQRDE